MFNDYWDFITERCSKLAFPLVQDKEELHFIYNLIQGCETYLEIGTAEGNSMFVLAHALKQNARIAYVDWDEEKIRPKRQMIEETLSKNGYHITGIHGNSHDPEIIMKANGRYDVVLIDAGHSYDDALEDARNYGRMATKYIIFHDINLLDVKRAFQKYQTETGFKSYTISNSETFGYGIMEVQ